MVTRASRLLALLCFTWITCAAGLAIAQPSFTVSVDRAVVPVGELVVISLEFEGVNPPGAPSLPELPNLRIASGVSQSSQYSFVNGQQTSKQTYSYSLQATKVGEVTIPALQAQAGGRTLVSQPVSLKIVPPNTPTASGEAGVTNLAFLRLLVPKTEVYVGEPFAVEVDLLFQQARDVQFPQLRADGFSLGQRPKPTATSTRIGNTTYQMIPFKQTAVAARTGTLTLGPAELSLTVGVPVNNRRRADPFDSIFGMPAFQGRAMVLTSESVPIQVLPLPTENVPEGFNGAIGSYQLNVSAGPTNLSVGDPITVRIEISGRGPIDAVTLPSQPQWRDFNSYPPTVKVETGDELGLTGRKTFEQVLVPQNHEVKVLAPVRFSFFDPTVKSYRTLSGRAIPLNVRPSATASTPPPSLTNSANASALRAADDIVHIKPRLDLAASAAPLLLARPWFVILQGVPALAWLSLYFLRKRRENLANNPRLRRRLQVNERVRQGLKELRAQAEARQPEQFFATLFRLLQEQLGERLDLPASAITEAVIDEKLNCHGLSPDMLKSLRDLFQTCNVARYAPTQTGQELAALIPTLEHVLHELQKLRI